MKKSTLRVNYYLQEQQSALELYLDALLCEVAVDVSLDPHKKPRQAQEIELDLGPQDNRQIGDKNEKIPIVVHTTAHSSLTDFQTESEFEFELDSKFDSTSVPDWATSEFQVMTFVVNGILCSAYINMLAGIISLPSNLNRIPGQAPWFIGLHRYKQKNVKIIDLAAITSNRKDASCFMAGESDSRRYIMLIGDGSWGFVIDRLEKMLSLNQDQLSMRLNRVKTDFMIATDTKNMSTLLDLDKLVQQLENC